MLPLMHDDIRKMRAIKDAEEIELMRMHSRSPTPPSSTCSALLSPV
ncbi:MAG: hypothetical protein ACLRM9_02945 [Collinsella aerofaciens]